MRDKLHYENQIHKLTQRDAATNRSIINKLIRRLRKLEGKA